MTRHAGDPREDLIDATIAAIAQNGLPSFSLRTVTAKIGRSTAAVSHHFGNRDGLLAAAARAALLRDTARHDALTAELAGLRLDAASAADFVTRYIEMRAVDIDPVARFWWELTFNGDKWAGATDIRERHRRMQATFWRRLFSSLHDAEVLSACITDIVSMESVFAAVLHGRTDYHLLMRETVRQAFSHADLSEEGIAYDLSKADPPHAPRAEVVDGLPAKLIESAAQQILLHGVSALNHRRLTAIAGVSPSMIVYHFGDTQRFTEHAVWAALLKHLPAALDFEVLRDEDRQNVESWYAHLLPMLGVGAGDAFYVGYARVLGQTCLLARDQPALMPLIRHLRILEGAGIHHASRTQWPDAFALNRAQAAMFAIWIKGFASSGAAAMGEAACRDRLTEVIKLARASRS